MEDNDKEILTDKRLLIVGGVLSAFKLDDITIVIFIMFLVLSLLYFVMLSGKRKLTPLFFRVCSIFVAATFSSVTTVVLLQGFSDIGILEIVVCILFYFVTVALVYIALRK